VRVFCGYNSVHPYVTCRCNKAVIDALSLRRCEPLRLVVLLVVDAWLRRYLATVLFSSV
jgi:hypothetical protein